jgi:hypothetical protein
MSFCPVHKEEILALFREAKKLNDSNHLVNMTLHLNASLLANLNPLVNLNLLVSLNKDHHYR